VSNKSVRLSQECEHRKNVSSVLGEERGSQGSVGPTWHHWHDMTGFLADAAHKCAWQTRGYNSQHFQSKWDIPYIVHCNPAASTDSTP
jgi:hypothetical protein